MKLPYLDLWADLWVIQLQTELMKMRYEARYFVIVSLRVTFFHKWGFRFKLYKT